jgi:hypothetical protein
MTGICTKTKIRELTMKLRFPLSDVTIEITNHVQEVQSPLFDDGFIRVNQQEFSMNVKEVARFYVSEGNYISISPYPGAAQNSIELFLNGSAYGAILHQRGILPMHGSSFCHNNTGIMLCGDSGAGKSSLTASFCLSGAEFLTDDVTPMLIEEGIPRIWVMSDRIKLWSDSLKQLNHDQEGLHRIIPKTDKFYLPITSEKGKKSPLSQIFLLSIHEKSSVDFIEINGFEKFQALRNEIYRWEYLAGMPETDALYFKQLSNISHFTRITKVIRPSVITIEELQIKIVDFLENR